MTKSHIAIYALLAMVLAWLIPNAWIGPQDIAPEDLPAASFYQGKARISGVEWGDGRPYISVVTENPEYPIDVTGWSVENGRGVRGLIGKGTSMLNNGVLQKQANILVGTGTTLFLLTEHSPVGVSFEKNICAGYLGRTQEFSPQISDTCPDITQAQGYAALSPSCKEVVSTRAECETVVPRQVASPHDAACDTFLTQKMNYGGCVSTYHNDSSFLLPFWYVYMDTKVPIVEKKGGTLILLDKTGKLVDYESYGPPHGLTPEVKP